MLKTPLRGLRDFLAFLPDKPLFKSLKHSSAFIAFLILRQVRGSEAENNLQCFKIQATYAIRCFSQEVNCIYNYVNHRYSCDMPISCDERLCISLYSNLIKTKH